MIFRILFFAIAFAGTIYAQDLPESPKPQNTVSKRPEAPTRSRQVLEGLDITLRSLDGYTTHRLLSDPCHCFKELDPIAPHTGNAAAIYGFQAGAGLAVIYGSRWLERKHHPKWAKALLIADIVSESIAVGNNFNLIQGHHSTLSQPIPGSAIETAKPPSFR